VLSKPYRARAGNVNGPRAAPDSRGSGMTTSPRWSRPTIVVQTRDRTSPMIKYPTANRALGERPRFSAWDRARRAASRRSRLENIDRAERLQPVLDRRGGESLN